MSGWIKLHRNLASWRWAQCPQTFSMWIHLLLMANIDDCDFMDIRVPRGSLVTSLDKLSNITGLSIQQTRTCLKQLSLTHEIEIQTTNRYTLITICKFDSYQSNDYSTLDYNETQSDLFITSKEQGDNIYPDFSQHSDNKAITIHQQSNNNNIRNKEYKNKRIKENIKSNTTGVVLPKESYTQKNFLSDLISLGVSQQTAMDWCACRKQKRLAFTLTAFEKTKRELEKIPDKTPEYLIRFAAEKGWGGFEASYYLNSLFSNYDSFGRNSQQRCTEIPNEGYYESTI